MNKVIIFSAPSGSGKTTLVKYCLQKFPQLQFSVSATTRKPRGQEVNGKDYYFLSLEDFKQKIKNAEFVEFEEVYQDNFYGTLQSEIDRIWTEKKVVIFDVDVIGGINLKKIYGEKAMSIFIAPPSIEELERRLKGRGTDDAETIQKRIGKARQELNYQEGFDKVIVNDDLEKAQSDIENLIQNFLQ